MCSVPLDPGGEVRGYSVGCTLGMLDTSPFRAALCMSIGSLQKKKMHFGAGVFWMWRDVFFFFERARPAASMRPACLIYLSTSRSPTE